jgi:hypothetical protein
MASTLSTLQATANALTPSSTPEAVQEFLNIGVRFLTDVLSMRGQSVEEWRAFRKQTISSELATIEEELAKLTDPIPV